MRLGRLSHVLSPQYSWCLRCSTTWNFVEPHFTDYDGGRGCFPLCEKCWLELTVSERIPFYTELIEQWESEGLIEEPRKRLIYDAVLAGR